eukprot:g9575.t1
MFVEAARSRTQVVKCMPLGKIHSIATLPSTISSVPGRPRRSIGAARSVGKAVRAPRHRQWMQAMAWFGSAFRCVAIGPGKRFTDTVWSACPTTAMRASKTGTRDGRQERRDGAASINISVAQVLTPDKVRLVEPGPIQRNSSAKQLCKIRGA